MQLSFRFGAALATAAALSFAAGPSCAQAPIVDASESRGARQPTPPAAAPQQPTDTSVQAELFSQLQQLQQELMQLRGMVEEQANQLRELKQQSLDRYIDLDRRVSQLSGGGSTGEEPAAAESLPAAGANAGSAAEAYKEAYALVRSREFPAAIQAFKAFQQQYPEDKYLPNSYYWLGALHMQEPQNLEAARQAFTQLLDQFPGHSKAPDAMYKLGQVYYYLGDKDRARQLLEQVVADYSGTASAAPGQASRFLQENF